jgi:hypothetical protein
MYRLDFLYFQPIKALTTCDFCQLNEVSLQVAHAAAHQLVDSSKAELFTAQQRLVMLNGTNAPQSEIEQANKAIKNARQHYDRAIAVSEKV